MADQITAAKTRLFWASDVSFDGIRLEAWSGETILMDVAIGENGLLTVSTWEKDIPAGLVERCLALGRERLIKDRLKEQSDSGWLGL